MTRGLLLSGGMDSVAIAYWMRPSLAITIDYGQKPAGGELRAASAVCEALNIQHHIIKADLSALGSGDLAGQPAEKDAPASEWWPFRNQMLVTLSAMSCIKHQVSTLLIGALRTDGFHVDGTAPFVRALSALLQMQEGGLTLEAPAIEMDAATLVRRSGIPQSILAWSHSCHVDEYACGFCRGCRKHYEVMEALGCEPY